MVLADEPTGNLDSAAGAGIIGLLTEITHDGTAVVVVTHDAGIAAAMERQVEMRDGRIVTDTGPPGTPSPGVCASVPGPRP